MPCGCKKGAGMSLHGGGVRRKRRKRRGGGMNVVGGGVRRKRRKRGGQLIGGNPKTWTPAYLSQRKPASGWMGQRKPLRRLASMAAASFLSPIGFAMPFKRGSGMSIHGSGMSIHGAGLRGKRALPRRGRGKRMI